MSHLILSLSIVFLLCRASFSDAIRPDLSCVGRPHANVTLTAYYPDFMSEDESDYLDSRGKKLRTLQEFLDGRASFVTVAMDEVFRLKYGSVVCIPELNEHFGKMIPLQVRDHGPNLIGKGFSRLDICVRSEADSYDTAVNRMVTLYTTV
ncbi:uncharacterized protein LOC106653521 isoform X2 [Trichogramma pretiosum]|uniref:uncharacterized protein LOC106653521 isoform X2 n=1 Tax=Trichogramma pretiosum TaxID=7493 RepID=UPI0006C9E28F|nr:uncharacterized protein LOC106653521 isoform X2 [Trichogramma pretiosum]